VTFVTPVRLVHNGQTATPADFHVLFRNVLRRVNFVNHLHCGGELSADAMSFITEAEGIRTIESRLRWHEWDRYSARQEQRVPMGGFVGEASYEGDISRLWPWLALGELVHVGKGATFGLGQYRSVQIPFCKHGEGASDDGQSAPRRSSR
jgi:CRISPR-associated endoribonuclease Cas6